MSRNKSCWQFARMVLENGETMYLNTEYITAYGYLKEQDKTVVVVLGEEEGNYFPGDQTQEIMDSFACIHCGGE